MSANVSLTSCAMLSRYCASARGSPLKASSFVVRPAGHLMLQFFAITHLSIIKAVVPNSKESPPKRHAFTTSEPVCIAPEHLSDTFCLMPFAQRAWWTSEIPSSAARPAYLSEVTDAAPVPPVLPATLITSAPAFATPTAIVPIPSELTNFTTTFALLALAS